MRGEVSGVTPEEKRDAAKLLRYWADFLLWEAKANQPAADEHRDLAAKLEAEARG